MQQIYSQIIEKLKLGHRPNFNLSEETLGEIKTAISRELGADPAQNELDDLKMALCILDHSRKRRPQLTGPLIKLLGQLTLPPFYLVAALGVSKRHIIEPILMEGHQIPSAYLQSLEKLLYHKNPEVVEWVLRCLEELGGQAKPLNATLEKIKPGLHKIFNQHNRNIREIIHLMQSRW